MYSTFAQKPILNFGIIFHLKSSLFSYFTINSTKKSSVIFNTFLRNHLCQITQVIGHICTSYFSVHSSVANLFYYIRYISLPTVSSNIFLTVFCCLKDTILNDQNSMNSLLKATQNSSSILLKIIPNSFHDQFQNQYHILDSYYDTTQPATT